MSDETDWLSLKASALPPLAEQMVGRGGFGVLGSQVALR